MEKNKKVAKWGKLPKNRMRQSNEFTAVILPDLSDRTFVGQPRSSSSQPNQGCTLTPEK